MSLVQSIHLPGDSCAAPHSGSIAPSQASTNTPPRCPAIRGIAYGLVFELMVAMSGYSAWLFFSHWRH